MATPIRNKYSTHPGDVLVHVKWRGSTLESNLKNKFNKVICKDLGPYDFIISGDRFFIFVPESELVATVNTSKISATAHHNVIVIAVRNRITSEQYSNLQDLIVINNNKILVPVGDVLEIPDLLHQWSVMDITPRKPNKTDATQSTRHLNLLMTIPGLGKLKAEKLLDTFGTIHRLAGCSTNELSTVVGSNLAGEIYRHFH